MASLFLAALTCMPSEARPQDWRARAVALGNPPAVVILHNRSVEIDSVTTAGLQGRLTETRDVGLLDLAAVDVESRLVVLDTPSFRLEDVRVEIIEGSGKQRVLGFDDLFWHEEGHRSNGVVYLDGRTLSTTVSPLQVGDRIRWTQVYQMVDAHGIPEFSFGGMTLPALETRVELVVPAGHTTRTGLIGDRDRFGAIEESENSEGAHLRSIWTARDLLPMRAAPWAPPGFDGAVRWTAQVVPLEGTASVGPHTSHSWSELGRTYLQSIAWRLEPDDDVTALGASLAADGEEELIAAAFEHVQREYRYLGLFEGRGGIEPVPAPITRERGYGDCKGLSALLLSILRSRGIEADPVLLRTGSFGPLDPDVPSLMQMNHFIVRARTGNGRVFWLDATTDGYLAGMVPAVDAVSPVLVLTPEGGELEQIPHAAWQTGSTDVTADYVVEPDGRLKGSWTISWTQGAAASVRALVVEEAELTRILVEHVLPPTLGLVDVLDASIDGWKEWRDPLVVRFTARTRRPLPRAGKDWLLPVVSVRRPDLRSLAATRRAPIDLRHQTSIHEEITLDMRTLEVDDMPSSAACAGAGGSWERSVEIVPATTLILRNRLTWPEDVVPAANAAELTQFIAEVSTHETRYLRIRPRGESR